MASVITALESQVGGQPVLYSEPYLNYIFKTLYIYFLSHLCVIQDLEEYLLTTNFKEVVGMERIF